MTITVTGTLPDPLGNPLKYTTIRITTQESILSPTGSFALIGTGDTGAYSFSLEQGKYLIEINQDGSEYGTGSYLEVTGSDVGSTNLPLLMVNNAYTPSF